MPGSRTRRLIHPWRLFAGLYFIGQFCCATAMAQRDAPRIDAASPPDRFRESISLETSRQASRQLSTAMLHAREGRWQEAVDELERVTASEGNALVPLVPGRYLNVRMYANLLVASFPTEGLTVYRKAVDPRAQGWYEAGQLASDDEFLLRVVHEGFASSYGDDALLLLGERAWERGDVGAARRFWEQILPLIKPPVVGEVLPVLRFPDTNLDRAQVFARLVLCSLLEGDFRRAELERGVFARMFPEATGTLAGRTGLLVKILDERVENTHGGKSSAANDFMPTFAVNSRRNGLLSDEVDVGAIRWQERTDDPLQRRRKPISFLSGGALNTFPIATGPAVFYCDSRRIFARDRRSGEPLWPSAENSSAVIYDAGGPPQKSSDQFVVGIPRYTLAESGGRLYARMGSPITGKSARDLREHESHIVCLDVAHGEGKLLWRTGMKEREEGWAFEGSPAVANGHLYVPLRRGFPQSQTNIACLDAQTGAFLWNRQVCSAVSDVSQLSNLVSHHLLTVGDGALFYSSDMGGVISLDAAHGTIRWVTTYESISPRNNTETMGGNGENLTPCLFHEGSVVAAPSDFDGLLVMDSQTGRVRWQRALPGGVRHLLGVQAGKLFVSGDSVWALDIDTGAIHWEVGAIDPVAHGFGQGLLAGKLVYWPTREEILVVEQATGEIRRRVALAAMYDVSGGNLAISDGLLIVAGPDEIVAFSEYSHGYRTGYEWVSAIGWDQQRPISAP